MTTEIHESEHRPTAKDENDAMLLQGELADALRTCTGLTGGVVNDWARDLVEYLRQRLGAQRIYIPAPSKAQRDAAIARDYDGTNAAAVMKRYGIRSRQRLHQIVEEQRRHSQDRLKSGIQVSCQKT